MSDGARVMVVFCLLVLLGAGIPTMAQPTAEAGISDVSISGSGVVSPAATGNDSTYLWQGESFNVSTTFVDYPTAKNYRTCIGYEREGAPARQLGTECALQSLPNGTNGTSTFTNVTWPANATGEQELVVELQGLSNETNATVLDRNTVNVTVLQRNGDLDGDGLTNGKEVESGYNVSNPDMDSDGLNDGAEVNQYGSNPQNPDTDGDGVRDGVEIQGGTDPAMTDTDGDGLNDRFETTGLLRTNATDSRTVLWLVLAALLVGILVVGGGVRVRRWWRERGGLAALTSTGSDETQTDTEDDVTADPPPTDPTPEPLTDEDRVLALLREHGGRMKQTRIVDETDWSKAKVSRLLSSMTEDGTIDKLSIGRENIISLDGHRPEAARSPHEENASD